MMSSPPLFEAKPAVFFIYPNYNQEVFYEGQQVAGVVRLDLVEPKRCRGVTLRLTGVAHTSWEEHYEERDREGHTHHRTRTVGSHSVILEQQCVVWAPQPGASDVIPQGQHALPFAFTLPAGGLPASFSSPTGSIRYFLRATVDRPWRFDHKAFRPITVLPVVAASAPQYAVPVSRSDEKTRCCCCCASGPICAEAAMNGLAWCPGEVVPVAVRVSNRSGSVLRGISCSLYQNVRYYSNEGPTNSSRWRLARSEWPQQIAPGASVDAVVHLRVPACCPSISRTSARVLELSYTLDAVVRLPSGSFDMTLRLPFEVATLPHQPQWSTAQSVFTAFYAQQPAQPQVAPSAPSYEDTYANSEPSAQQMGGEVHYAYFPAPSAPSGPQAALPPAAGGETASLLGSQAQHVELPPPPPTCNGLSFCAASAGEAEPAK